MDFLFLLSERARASRVRKRFRNHFLLLPMRSSFFALRELGLGQRDLVKFGQILEEGEKGGVIGKETRAFK